MAEQETQNKQEKIIESFSWIFFGCLLIAALIDPLSVSATLILILTSLIGLAGTFIYQRFLTSGPYEESVLLPLKLWLFVFLFALVVAVTGGVNSGYIVLLFYPVINASIQLDLQQSLTLGMAGYFLAVIFSVFVPASREFLWQKWPLIFIQAGVLGFVSYWISILANAFLKEKKEKENILHLENEKSEFIGLASHHLRTPITSIKGYVDYFLRGSAGGELTEEQAKIIERLDSVIKKIEAVVENLLMAASMENGRVKLNKRLSHFARMIETTCLQFRSAAEERGIKLVYEIPNDESLQEITCDESKVRKVLFNFLSNALKYTERGFIKVIVSKAGNQIQVCVLDSGIGISKTDMPYLFQKFARAGSVRGAFDQEGVGLGLFTSRLIIEAHGGKIWADSEPGKGSAFYFTLPTE